MKRHVLAAPLAVLSVAFLFGCQEQASSPVGPEGPQFHENKPASCKGHHKNDAGCVDPPPPETEEATFTAIFKTGDISGDDIFLLGGHPVLATEHPGGPATLDLSFFDNDDVIDDGSTCFGFEDGEFTTGFSIIVKKNDLKNALANFAAFTAKGNDAMTDVNYGLALYGEIDTDNDWPPTNTNTIWSDPLKVDREAVLN